MSLIQRSVSSQVSTNQLNFPLFLCTRPEDVKTLDQLTTLLLSLVTDFGDGYDFGTQGSIQARALLRRLLPIFRTVEAKRSHLEDGSFSRLTESLVSLLNCSNKDLVQTTLYCLSGICCDLDRFVLFDFVEAELISLLPQEFFLQEMHLCIQPELSLMNTLIWFTRCVRPEHSREICDYRQLSMDTFNRIFTDKFFRPIKPFLDFVCHNRRRIADTWSSHRFPWLLGVIIGSSPFLEQMTLFVLSSPIVFAFMDSLIFFESDKMTHSLLQTFMDDIIHWQAEDPAVQQREKLIMAKLREEGLADEIELRFRFHWFDFGRGSEVFLGAQVMHCLGGNVPF
ncbi:hypothetical protein BLNAU_14449 [Blattamonas nauphoetae]|uniref:Uncharacterized protein n=1 Tax=Blattamonas nauphoetae TaxID=2049346 RepID=A0ABQ9XH52_9EUKA|nr:hypothetical protein BLNAU_14449 [Blattamonas nauphoetae]